MARTKTKALPKEYVTLYADVTALTPKAVQLTRDGLSVWIPLRCVRELEQARVGEARIDVERWVASDRGVLS